MKLTLSIITIFLWLTAYSQVVPDTVYSKNFKIFIQLTEKLNKASHRFENSTEKRKRKKLIADSIAHYANQVSNSFKYLDSLENYSFGMGNYFEDGKRAGSRNLTSPIAQLQCSYMHYMQNLRNAKDSIQAIVRAALTLEGHLKNGFPSSIYCPYIYDAIKFGPGLRPTRPPIKKIIIPDSLRMEN
jgi:hypothetical protein